MTRAGLSCPDISLLTSIADILGVTTGELLNGQRSQSAASEDFVRVRERVRTSDTLVCSQALYSVEIEKTIDNAFVYAEKSAKSKMISFQNMLAVSFSAVLLLGILVCSVCDIAISGTFSWSLYPITAIIFAWLVLIPLVKYGSKGTLGSLVIFSVFIIPFLYVMRVIIGNHLIMTIGVRMSLCSIAYLWCVYLIFRKFKERKIIAAAISLLLTIPLCIIINISLAKTLSISAFDIWDLLSFAVITMIVVALFIIDYYKIRKCSKEFDNLECGRMEK